MFSERLVSPRLAETLADDLGVTTAVLDPIEGLSDETADEDYLSLMRENLSALEHANGCPVTTRHRSGPCSATGRSPSAAARSCAAST